MPVTLDQILAATRERLPDALQRAPAIERAALARPAAPDFAAALRGPTLALIAEVKRRSPSAGAINTGIDAVARARTYADAGAAAISVLTDEPHFGGRLADLEAVAAQVRVPVLRKDFILHEVQLLEARAAGAAAALLIVRALDDAMLRRLLAVARSIGLATLVEVHTAPELERALEAGAQIVGVNSRDLDTFRIDTAAAWSLLASVPVGCVAVAESGMQQAEDVHRAADAGADAVLIGTALSMADDPAALVRSLVQVPVRGRGAGARAG